MLSPLKNLLIRKFSSGHPRSIKTKRNILALFVLRGVAVGINFLLVPMTLRYLNPTNYGIWLTLSSIISWVSMLDIGLGNGLRNKFAVAVAKNDIVLARTYVSTTYTFIGAIAGGLLILFLIINPALKWAGILNAPMEMETDLSHLAAVVFAFFCLRLVFGLIGTVLIADQKPAMSTSLEVVGAALSLAAVYGLMKTSHGSLFWLGFWLSCITAAVPFCATVWFFRGRYKRFSPTLHSVDTAHARELVHIGLQFFILQLAGLLVFASSNVVITQLFGPSEVTSFNIAFKYYGVALMLFTILLTPFWSAYTEAFVRGDTGWITMTIRKLRNAWLVLALALFVMTLSANNVYKLWVGGNIQIPESLSISMAFYVLIVAWGNIFAYFIAGTGRIRLQLWVALGTSVLVIPTAILMASIAGLRSTGVILATCLWLLPGCFLWPVQMKKLVTARASGIWGK